jgi:uncharacterized protein YegL
LYAAIVLAAAIFELDSDPIPRRKMKLSYVTNNGDSAVIIQLDSLANFEVGHDA